MKDKIIEFINRLEKYLLGFSIEPLKKLIAKFDFDRFTIKDFSKKFIATAFAILIFVISVISVGTVAVEKNKARTAPATTEQTTEETEIKTTASEKSDIKGNFLLCIMNDERTSIDMLSLLFLDSESSVAKFSYLNKNMIVNVDGFSGSFIEHYNRGGMSELVWAVGEQTGLIVDRYISGTNSKLSDFLSSFKSFSVDVEKTVEHEFSGIGYIIEKGQQDLTGDAFSKYLIYLCAKDETGKLTELLTLLGEMTFNVESEILMNQCERILGIFETNITAHDFGTAKNALCFLASNPEELKVSVVKNPQDLKN